MASSYIIKGRIYSTLTLQLLPYTSMILRFAVKHLTVLASSSYTSYKELWQEALEIHEVRMRLP